MYDVTGELANFEMLPAITNSDSIIRAKIKAKNFGITELDENGDMSVFFKDNMKKSRRFGSRWLK